MVHQYRLWMFVAEWRDRTDRETKCYASLNSDIFCIDEPIILMNKIFEVHLLKKFIKII